jgi:DNA replication protein DnaC
MDSSQAIAEMLMQIPNRTSTSLYSDNKDEGAYCCLTCQKEMTRIYFGLMKKYVMPSACKCDVIRMEKEEEERLRKLRRAQLEKTYKHSIMSEGLKTASFGNFISRRGTELCLTESKKFSDEFEDRKEGLLMFGKPGNGKSHLLAAIHHDLDRRGYVSLFLDVSQLFNIAKDTFKFSSKVSLTDIITAAIDCDLLTLDEIGSGTLTETEFNDILFPIINGRQGKKTNYTSNLDLKRLNQWFAFGKKGEPLDVDGRLIDRIIGSSVIIENHGTSKRQEDAMNRMNA